MSIAQLHKEQHVGVLDGQRGSDQSNSSSVVLQRPPLCGAASLHARASVSLLLCGAAQPRSLLNRRRRPHQSPLLVFSGFIQLVFSPLLVSLLHGGGELRRYHFPSRTAGLFPGQRVHGASHGEWTLPGVSSPPL